MTSNELAPELARASIGSATSVRKRKLSLNIEKISFYVLTSLFLLYIFLPMLSIILFSFAGKWTNTVLPETWTWDAYVAVFTNKDFASSLLRSSIIGVSVVLIDIIIVLCALLGVSLMRNKKIGGAMELLSIIPVALPGVVLALGCILFYGEAIPLLLGSPLLLIFAEAAFALPIVFWTMKNAFRSIDAKVLYEASSMLGGSTLVFLRRVLVPNLRKGIITAGIMAFTTAFNNFALAQLITGSSFKTLPMVQKEFMRIDGHQTSAMAIISILITFILAYSLSRPSRRKVR